MQMYAEGEGGGEIGGAAADPMSTRERSSWSWLRNQKIWKLFEGVQDEICAVPKKSINILYNILMI